MQARLHGLGGLQQELLEQMARDVEAQPDRLGEPVVGLRLHHQCREARFGKVRAGVLRELIDDVAVAAVEQDVGHRFRRGDGAPKWPSR